MLPQALTPLAALTVSVALTSRLALGSLTPIDPFAHPKYALQFLNDLPLERRIAESWVERGSVPGGWRGFLNEIGPSEAKSTVPTLVQEKREKGDEGELEIHRSSQEGGTKDEEKPEEGEDGSYTLQSIMLRPGPRSYVCLIPPPPLEPKEKREPLAAPDMSPESLAQLLRHLDGTCLYLKQGWFTYSYCHGQEVRQFRAADRTWPPPPGGWVPTEDPQYDPYILGTAKHDLQIESNSPGISLGRGVGARYLTARWGGGTICDPTGDDREIEIQFHCSMTGTDGISLIKEVSTCSYILVIDTPRLCNIPGFSSAHLSEPPTNITCREIVPDGSIPKAEIEGMTKTSSDRTPLPSWAIIEPPPPQKAAKQATGQQNSKDSSRSQPQSNSRSRSKSQSQSKGQPVSKSEPEPNAVHGTGPRRINSEDEQNIRAHSDSETKSGESSEPENKPSIQAYVLKAASAANDEEIDGAGDGDEHRVDVARLLKILGDGQADGRFISLLSDSLRTPEGSVSEGKGAEEAQGEERDNQGEEEEVWQILVLKDENGDDLILEVPVEGYDGDGDRVRDEL